MVSLRYSGFRGCPGIGRYAGFDPIEHLTFSQTVDGDITLYCVETLLKRKIHSFIYTTGFVASGAVVTILADSL